jgi:hypothetical protein
MAASRIRVGVCFILWVGTVLGWDPVGLWYLALGMVFWRRKIKEIYNIARDDTEFTMG